MSTEKITYCYKLLNRSIPVHFDAYLPSKSTSGSRVPAVIYFHGGGLTVGNKDSWFPTWLQSRVLTLGYIFISSNYQLLPHSTGHDVVKDVQDLSCFLAENNLVAMNSTLRVDMDKIAVSGTSAGGLCAYLAVMHCSPKPKALISLYGMGGNFLTPHYFRPKSQVFFRGRELLEPSDFARYIYPFAGALSTLVVDSPLAYHPPTYHIPGYPANPRMLLARLYLQLGVFLDYYTGEHNPSLSKTLLHVLETRDRELDISDIPEEHRSLFPQFGVDKTWPPTLLLHGTHDTAVPVDESRALKTLLEESGVAVELIELEGREHSFDYEPGSEETLKGLFDSVEDFLRNSLDI